MAHAFVFPDSDVWFSYSCIMHMLCAQLTNCLVTIDGFTSIWMRLHRFSVTATHVSINALGSELFDRSKRSPKLRKHSAVLRRAIPLLKPSMCQMKLGARAKYSAYEGVFPDKTELTLQFTKSSQQSNFIR